jgi:2-dehydropantoate 2-reductase
MRIAIVGAGAIGSAYGFLLAQGGHAVVLLDTWREHVDAIAEHGLEIDGEDGWTRTARLAATTDPTLVSDAEAVLVLVKAFATEEAARSIAGFLDPGAIVVTLQNGIGNDARLAGVLGSGPVVQGSTTVGAQVLGPGRVSVAPGTRRGQSLTSLGRPASPDAAAGCERLAAALNAASLPAVVLDDVSSVVWRKLAMAAGIGPLCATLDCSVAAVLERPAAGAVLRQAFDEIVAVAAAEGVELDAGDLWSHALETYRSIGPHRPSLAVDVAQGRATEIEAQLGEVQRRGVAAGIATPASDILATVIRAKAPIQRNGGTERKPVV